MPDPIEQLRTTTENGLQELLGKLRPKHRQRVMNAISQYGNVGNVPQAFWNELQADINEESTALMLLLLVAVYRTETKRLGLEIADESRLKAQATPAAQALGRDVARDYSEAIKRRLTQQIDSRIGELNSAGPKAATEAIRTAVNETIDAPQAESATITNTTRGVSTGQGSAFDDAERTLGVAIDVKWSTERDARVCPICSPLEGRPSIDWVEKFPEGPPAHPRCLLPGTHVLTSNITAAMRVRYDGPTVRLITAKGRDFAITTKHPLLTNRGWVRSGLIEPGDQLVAQRVKVSSSTATAIKPAECNTPPLIEDVFRACLERAGMFSMSVPSAPEYLHGEGQFGTGEIDVVFPNGFFGNCVDSSIGQSALELQLVADGDCLFLPCNSPLNKALIALSSAANGSMGSRRQSLSLSGVGLRHAEEHGFGTIASGDAFQLQSFDDYGSADPELLRKCLNAHAGVIEFDDVVDVKFDSFHGFVYDIETYAGLYTGNGVVTSNCRCVLKSYFPQGAGVN